MTDRNYTCVADAMQPSKIERPNKRLTQEQFLQKAIAVHGDKYDYSETIYVKSKEKALFKCREHGVFSQKPNDHLKGRGCPECKKSKLTKPPKVYSFNPLLPNRKKGSTKPLSKNEFLVLAKAKQGDKFDYSLVPDNGIRMKGRVTVICKTCNHTYDIIVSSHVNTGNRCPSCSGYMQLDNKTFIERAIKVHGEKYDYSLVEYRSNKEKVKIFCKNCNDYFYQSPSSHLLGKQGCKACGVASRVKKRTKTKERFISEAIEVHGSKYSYENVIYKTAQIKILVTCPKHGVFSIQPSEHLYGKGCRSCARELSVGFSKERFEKLCLEKNRKAILYVLKLSNKDEVFYKIGITSRSVRERYYGSKVKYDLQVELEIVESAGYVFDLEKRLHRLLKKHHYQPLIPFEGSRKECFSFLPKDIVKLLTEVVSSTQLQLIA